MGLDVKINKTMLYSHLCSTQLGIKWNIFVILPHIFFSFQLGAKFCCSKFCKEKHGKVWRGYPELWQLGNLLSSPNPARLEHFPSRKQALVPHQNWWQASHLGLWSPGGYGAGRYPPQATLCPCQSSNARCGQKIIHQLGKGSKLLELLDFILGHLDLVTAAMGLLAITFWDWEEQQTRAVPEAVLVRVCRARATGAARVVNTHLRQDGAGQGCSTKSVWQMRNSTHTKMCAIRWEQVQQGHLGKNNQGCKVRMKIIQLRSCLGVQGKKRRVGCSRWGLRGASVEERTCFPGS